jgi:hypothetical protein
MGIFDSKKEIHAASVTTKILEDYDDPLPGIVAGASITNQNIPEVINEYFTQGYFSRSQAFYKYGRDHYVRGLPDSSDVQENPNYKELRAIIESSISQRVLFGYVLVSSEYEVHYATQYLQDHRALNTVTMEVMIPPPGAGPGTPVYYVNTTVASNKQSLTIHYSYDTLGTIIPGMDETIALPYKDQIVYQLQYQTLNDALEVSGVPVYWMYVRGTGTYPTLDVTTNESFSQDERFYPIIPFYENKTQIGDPANEGTPLYDTSKKLVEKLGFDYEEIVTSLEEGTEESLGKDKGLYAYLFLGINPVSGILPNYETATTAEKNEYWKINQASIYYLMDFFTLEANKSKSTKSMFDEWRANPKKIKMPALTTIGITDNTFKAKFNYKYITSIRKTGSVGPVGFCTSEIIPDESLGSYVGAGGIAGTLAAAFRYLHDITEIIYRKQETDTTYLEIVVCGLQQVMLIFNDTASVTYPIDALKDEDPYMMTIPLDRNIVTQMPNKYRNRVIHAAMCFVFNSYLIQEIKWYQQKFWSFAFTSLAIALSVPSGGASFTWAQVFSIAGLKAAAYALIVTYLRYLVFNEITAFAAKKLGVEATYILAIIAMAYGKGVQSGSLPGMPWAVDLLGAGTTMWSSTNKIVQEKSKDIQQQYLKMEEQTNIAEKELKKAEQLLNTSVDIDPWLFVNPLPDMLFGQSAESFIDSKAHNPNPGVLSLDSARNYVDLMLTLPTIDDTLTK